MLSKLFIFFVINMYVGDKKFKCVIFSDSDICGFFLEGYVFRVDLILLYCKIIINFIKNILYFKFCVEKICMIINFMDIFI